MSSRRQFVLSTGAGAIAASASAKTFARAGDKDIRVGVMGLSRGLALAKDLTKLPGVSVKYVCDVDSLRTQKAITELKALGSESVKGIGDFRSILEDDSIDALVCAAPNHWHAPATIMACKAGKHVYVEKPCSHSPAEGEAMIQAADKFKKCVQMGTQRRSYSGVIRAMSRLHSGAIGEPKLARCYYSNLRGSIGVGTKAVVPENLDYELWQGPIPAREYTSNVVHYNWHWFWHWGGGELGNNGPHGLDLCRWGLEVDFPVFATSAGARTWFQDDQETPDVQTACFGFEGGKQITWQATSCNRHQPSAFCTFFGDKGSMELEYDGVFRIYDRDDKLVEESAKSNTGQRDHLLNFIEAVREDSPEHLTQPIEEGHKSTLLCQLGNIAYRTNETVHSSRSNGHILGSKQQADLWEREYARSWVSDLEI